MRVMSGLQSNEGHSRLHSSAGGGDDRLPRWIILMTISALGVFVITAVVVESGTMDGLDLAILNAMGETVNSTDPWGPPWFEETVVEISALGGYPVIVVVTTVAAVALWLLSLRGGAILLLTALGTGALASTLLKIAFDRSRPDLVEPLDRTFTASFPSGHAMISMLSWMTLAAVVSCYVPVRAVRVFILCAAFLLAIAIGISRIYLGVHWPSDVFAGWAIGLAWAGAAWLVAHSKIGLPHERVY